MASNLVNVNLCYIEIELCIAQLRTQVRRLVTQVRGNILAVSISGAALPYSAVWDLMPCSNFKKVSNVFAKSDKPFLRK